jgi:hypothetical protein
LQRKSGSGNKPLKAEKIWTFLTVTPQFCNFFFLSMILLCMNDCMYILHRVFAVDRQAQVNWRYFCLAACHSPMHIDRHISW